MEERVVMASRFKEQCLALLDEVARTKVAIVVTKHHKPVARVVPVDTDHERKPLRGSVTFLVDDERALFATGGEWQVDSGEDR